MVDCRHSSGAESTLAAAASSIASFIVDGDMATLGSSDSCFEVSFRSTAVMACRTAKSTGAVQAIYQARRRMNIVHIRELRRHTNPALKEAKKRHGSRFEVQWPAETRALPLFLEGLIGWTE